MRRNLLRAMAAPAAALALVAAGCGGDDDEAASTGTAAATQGGEPVKIGLVTATGTASGIVTPDVVAAMKAGVKGLNEEGGLAGRQVELVYCNDKGDPNETARCGREMVEEGVIAVVGGALLNGPSLTPILEAADIPQVGLNPVTGTDFTSENVYLVGCGSFCAYQVSIAYAIHNDLPMSLVSTDNPVAAGYRPRLEDVAEQSGGSFTNTVLVPPNTSDFAPIVAAARRNGTKSVLMYVSQPETAQFINAAQDAGDDFQYFSTTQYSPEQAKEQLGGAEVAAQVTTAASLPPLNTDNPVVKRFVSEMEASGDPDADIGKLGFYAFPSWLGLYAIQQVVEQANLEDLTGEALKAALDDAKDVDMGGVIPPWTPTAPGPEGLERVSNQAIYLSHIVDGEPELITKDPVTPEQAIAGDFG